VESAGSSAVSAEDSSPPSTWEREKHGLDRSATVHDREEDRRWKQADRTEDRSAVQTERSEDRRWKESDRAVDRGFVTADRLQDRQWKEDDRADDQDWEMRKLAWTAEFDRAKVIHDSRVELAKGAVARAAAGAEFVRNAAAGIVAIYQLILGLAFGIAAGQHPLPISGVLPALFLGLAVTFASAYMAWLSKAPAVPGPIPAAALSVYEARRLNAFTDWVSKLALDRVYALHAAVLALGVGTVVLPAPFIGADLTASVLVGAAGLLVVLVGPALTKQT
jgi:hypothetical protein